MRLSRCLYAYSLSVDHLWWGVCSGLSPIISLSCWNLVEDNKQVCLSFSHEMTPCWQLRFVTSIYSISKSSLIRNHSPSSAVRYWLLRVLFSFHVGSQRKWHWCWLGGGGTKDLGCNHGGVANFLVDLRQVTYFSLWVWWDSLYVKWGK